MTCHNCRIECRKAGRRPDGQQRYRCAQCSKTFSEPKDFGLFGHKQVDEARTLQALHMICEGNSIRSTCRITGLSKTAILKAIEVAGEKCETFLAANVRDVPVSEVQIDEAWGFCLKKESSKWPFEAHMNEIGDAWIFIGIERTSKVVLAFELGKRTLDAADRFMTKLANAAQHEGRFQLSADGWPGYPTAVGRAFGHERVDFAQLVKIYAQDPGTSPERRYSPAEVTGTTKKAVYGDPDMARVCTSHIERQNGSLRQWCKRLTRLSYSFSKKWSNLRAALALHFAFYNYCRVHSSLKMTPAMASGLTSTVWKLADLLTV